MNISRIMIRNECWKLKKDKTSTEKKKGGRENEDMKKNKIRVRRMRLTHRLVIMQ